MALNLEKDPKFTCQRGCQGCDYCKVVEGLFEIRRCSNTRCEWMGEAYNAWWIERVVRYWRCVLYIPMHLLYQLGAIFCIHLVLLKDITVHKQTGIGFMLKLVPSLSVLLGQIHVVSVNCYNTTRQCNKTVFLRLSLESKGSLNICYII